LWEHHFLQKCEIYKKKKIGRGTWTWRVLENRDHPRMEKVSLSYGGLLPSVCHGFYYESVESIQTPKHWHISDTTSSHLLSPVSYPPPNLKVFLFPPGWLRGGLDRRPIVNQSVFPHHTNRLIQRPQE
jgi:hypothetical protein